MPTQRLPRLPAGLVFVLVATATAAGCGRADDDVASAPAPGWATAGGSAPSSAVTPSASAVSAPPARPAMAATGLSIRLTDGRSVAALDPASGVLRAAWPSAAISLEGDHTVALEAAPPIARWYDARGEPDRSGPVPEGLVPGITSADGRWAVFTEPAPERVGREIGPRRATSRFVVTDGAGWTREVTLPGNFTPEAFGFIEAEPKSLQLIEYLPPDRPETYRVRTLDLATGTLGLPVSLRDKTTPVDEAMAGASRTQVYAGGAGLLFTLYESAAGEGSWEYGFVHTLATGWSGVWCIDLPEELELAHSVGALALSADERRLYVVSGEGMLGEIAVDDLSHLEVGRMVDLGVVSEDPPTIVAAAERIWVSLGGKLLALDPTSLEVLARAEVPAPASALQVDAADGTLVAADADHLRYWSLDQSEGSLSEDVSRAMPLPSGLGTISRIVMPA